MLRRYISGGLVLSCLCAAAAVLSGCSFNINGDGDIKVAPDIITEEVHYAEAAPEEPPVTEAAVTEEPAVTEPSEEPAVTSAPEPEPEPYYKVPDKLTKRRSVISTMDAIYQGDLLTGCEATGLTTALNWYGYDIDKFTLAENYMPKGEVRFEPYPGKYWKGRNTDFCKQWDGATVGPDYMDTFVGSPYREDNCYGCYSPCIVRTANNFFDAVGSSYRAKDISGTDLYDLFRYVEAGIPVIVIVTPGLMEPEPGDYWYAEDKDELVFWQKGHHCMVIFGYDLDDSYVYASDPATGCLMVYDLITFRDIYDVKGQSACYISTGDKKIPQIIHEEGDEIMYSGRTYKDPYGKEEKEYTYNPWLRFEIDIIDPDESRPYRVHLKDMGWVSADALAENQPYYTDSETEADTEANEEVSEDDEYDEE